MLEEVGIQFLIIQSQVRFDVVREFDDLEVDPFFGQERFDFVEDFSVGNGGCADGDGDIFEIFRELCLLLIE